MSQIRITIDGLEQNETQERVRRQLEGIIGIHNACTSAGQDYIEVNYDERTSVAEINSHLQNNGYKVIDIL